MKKIVVKVIQTVKNSYMVDNNKPVFYDANEEIKLVFPEFSDATEFIDTCLTRGEDIKIEITQED